MLTVGRESGFDAGVDCWGGGVVMSKEQLNDKNPVAPIDYTANVSCPILGLFGEEDQSPTLEQVDIHEAELKKHGKDYEFHRYPNAGHGFFYYHRPAYRVEHAVDGWGQDLGLLREAPQLALDVCSAIESNHAGEKHVHHDCRKG